MPLGPLPYEVMDVVSTNCEHIDGYYVYSEVSELYGGDDLYGVLVIVSGDGLADKLKRVLSVYDEIPESSIETEFTEMTRDGVGAAEELEDELIAEAREFIANE